MLPTRTPKDHDMEEGRLDHCPAGSELLDAVSDQEASDEDSSGLRGDQFPTNPLLPIDKWPTQPIPVLGNESFSFQPGDRADEIPSVAQQMTGAGSYLVQARNLAKSSGIYALAAVASPLVSLVLAPYLTRQLSRTDYGMLTVLTTVISLTAGITQLGLGSAFFRSYNYDYTEPGDRRAVLATITVLLPLISIPVAVVAVLLSPILAGVVLHSSSLGGFIVLAAAIVVVQNLTVPGFAWLRAESRPLFFSALSMSNVLMVLCANLVLVGLLHFGIAGSLLATGSGYATVVLCTLPVILWRTRLRARRDIAWNLLTFGAPQVLSYISYWVLQLSDRYLLGLFVSYAQAGSYAVAYSLGSVLSTLIISPFSLAWPTMMYSVAKREDAPQVFRMVFRWFSMLLLFVAFALSIAGSLLLDWFFLPSYHSAAPIIPVVAESIVFFGLYVVFMSGASIRRKTWMPAAFSGLAAVVNVALNLVLIPLYGAWGAAASTLIAYIVMALVAYLANQRIYPVPYEIRRFLLALLIGAALYIGAGVLSVEWSALWRWLLIVICLVLYGAWLLFLTGGLGLLRAHGARLLARITSDRRVS